jgi:predicted enzyme related to lactoylglutathione lyase
MARVVHFEVTADEPERAVDFYRKAFGWKIERWEGGPPYWLIDTGEGVGSGGAIMPRGDHEQAVINTVGVESIEDATAAVRAAGGEVLMDPPDEIPGVGLFAYARDTEGNEFGLLQPAPPRS